MELILGGMYYISFIDDFSHKKQISFFNTKDEVFSMFKEFKFIVENHTRNKIKVLRSNNGDEYTCNSFKGFWK